MVLLAVSAALLTTSWRAPWPRMWTSEDGTYALAVTPARQVDGRVIPVRFRLFCHNEDGVELTLWRSDGDFYPNKVLISPDARVIALNEYPGYSQRTAVAVFSDSGKVLVRYGIGDLMTEEEVQGIAGNEGLKPKIWVQRATFQSVRNLVTPPPVAPQPVIRTLGQLRNLQNEWPQALEIQTVTGRTLWFDLLTGRLVRGGPSG